MTNIPPPSEPGMYADAQGAWWYWDGATWTPANDWGQVAAAPAGRHSQERGHALLMWILYLVLGGWIAALVFYLISSDKPFTRHHSAEALNLSIVMFVVQIASAVLLVPGYIELLDTADESGATWSPSPLFWVGLGLLITTSLVNYVLGIIGAVKAHRGEWWRVPIGVHPVRGVRARGAQPPYDARG